MSFLFEEMNPNETVVASACLCGETCLWHSKRQSKHRVIRDLENNLVEVIPVCPEMLGGLPCPRPPVKTRRGRIYVTDAETRTTFGVEITATFRAGAEAAYRKAHIARATKAYFHARSPSCARNGIAGRLFADKGIQVISVDPRYGIVNSR